MLPFRLTICLNANIHKGFGGMRNRITAKFDVWASAERIISSGSGRSLGCKNILLHDYVAQSVSQSMVLFLELKRSSTVRRAGELCINA